MSSEHDNTTTPQTAAYSETDALRQKLVESLMGIIGAPDDEDVARTSDRVLRTLDARLTQEAQSA